MKKQDQNYLTVCRWWCLV